MRPASDTPDTEPSVLFNGVDARTGQYLLPPLALAEIATLARGDTARAGASDKAHLAELQHRHASREEAHYGVKAGVDPTQLEQAGWGVVFPAVPKGSSAEREQAAIREALTPLLALRRSQSSAVQEGYYKEFRGPDGYRSGESKQRFLARLGAGPGPADPALVPYYLLLVASPETIPYQLQYQLDVQYAVGRIHFDTIQEYANYAQSVVAAERLGHALPREIALVGVANNGDGATQKSCKHLIEQLATKIEAWSAAPPRKVVRCVGDDARKAHVAGLFGGPKAPALLFTASHGVGFPKGDPLQTRHQGALVLQDWGGPATGAVEESQYFSADDVAEGADLTGRIAFFFACYGAGTPELDSFARQAFQERQAIAERSFVAGLPRRLLGHPRGALCVIGHVDRAWGSSFLWPTGKRPAPTAQLAVFESALRALLDGAPAGVALEYFNARYAELASDLTAQLEELEYDPEAIDDYALADLWTSRNDSRGYAIVGDPAVRLSLGDPGDPPEPERKARS